MLTVKEHDHAKTTILELSGPFDAQSPFWLEAVIIGAMEMGCQHIIFNFSQVTWIDSIGLGQLFLWYHNTRSSHIRLSIVNPQESVRSLLESAHIPEIISIYVSQAAAIEAFRLCQVVSDEQYSV